MSRRRVSVDRLQELVRLHRLGSSSREIVRLLRMGPNTERAYREAFEEAGLLAGSPHELPPLGALKKALEEKLPAKQPEQQRSSIEAWKEEVAGLLKAKLQPQAIYDKLRLKDPSFPGSLSAVKRLCVRVRREQGVQPEDVAIPVETAAGEVAQVDFGYAGRFYDPERGVLRRAWVFVMVLGYSRHMFARLVFDQKVETWLRLHAEAFAELGGVPRVVVPDNLKSAVIKAAFGLSDEPSLNRSYVELARHYGFKIDPTPPRSPEKKGKVESGVKYAKRNCLKALAAAEDTDVGEADAILQRWVREIAGLRNHGTTGRKPLVVFAEEEQAQLLPLPARRFEPVVWKVAKVHRDSHVSFERRLYSVPWQHLGEKVWVRATASTVTIHSAEERIATHPRCGPLHRSTIESHLPKHRGDLRHRSRGYWEGRAERIGPETSAYVRQVFDSDDVLHQLRAVQAIVTHLEGFPRARAEAATRRAAYYGNYTYKGVKKILADALDLEPLPGDTPTVSTPSWSARFARKPGELFPDLVP